MNARLISATVVNVASLVLSFLADLLLDSADVGWSWMALAAWSVWALVILTTSRETRT